MKLTQCITLTEGLTPTGLVVTGAVVGAASVPLIKKVFRGQKNLRQLAVGLTGVAISTGRRLKDTACKPNNYWKNIVAEAQTRYENKKTERLKHNTGSPGKTIKNNSVTDASTHTFLYKRTGQIN